MASFSVSVPHPLEKDAALDRVRRFLENVQRDYAAHLSDAKGAWTDNRLDFSFKASGFSISGNLVVDDSKIQVSGPLPFAASLFRGRIEQTIRDELMKLLS